MLGPYKANKDGTISYKGNKLFKPMKNIDALGVPLEEFKDRVTQFDSNEMWKHIAKINHQINLSANLYFEKCGAYYTSDTSPITLKWFNMQKEVFLSESSQIYLELALVQKEV